MRRLEYPVLGHPVRFESDSDDVLEIVEDAFGGWDCLGEHVRSADEPVLVRFEIGAGPEGAPDDNGHVAVHHFCPDDERVIARSSGSYGVSDPGRREATAVVTSELVADREHFRETFLEALTFALLSVFDRHPLHAAGIARDGHAVLLAGPSGSGKSSLALVAHGAGFRILGDDHIWIQRTPTFRVWGAPRNIRLVSDGPTDDPRGKSVVPLRDARHDPEFYSADTATVCVLARGSQASLSRIDAETVAEALTTRIDPGFDRFPQRHPGVVDALASRGGWQLTLSPNANDTLPFLRTMLEQQ